MKKKKVKQNPIPQDFPEFLASIDHNLPLDLSENEYLIYKICAFTGLKFDKAKIILEYILQTIRSQMLLGKKIILRDLGKLVIEKPLIRNTKFKKNNKRRERIKLNTNK